MFLALALTVFVAVIQLLESISTARLSEELWKLWTNHAPNSSFRELRSVRNDMMKIRTERSETSSQDEFAKWARLDRQHQQLKKKYEKMSAQVGGDRQRFNRFVKIGKWICTSGTRWLVQWKYSKTPVVWFPLGVLPKQVEWLLSLPSAPRGSISSVTWIFVTNSTIGTVISIVKRGFNWNSS